MDAMLEFSGPNTQPHHPRPHGLQVLVVEDEPLIRWATSEILDQSGHTVTTAETAAAAIAALTTSDRAFDVILLDYRLPDSDNLALLTRIRHLSPHSAVVMMTSDMAPDSIDRALALGAARVMHKPFDIHVLPEVVEHAGDRAA